MAFDFDNRDTPYGHKPDSSAEGPYPYGGKESGRYAAPPRPGAPSGFQNKPERRPVRPPERGPAEHMCASERRRGPKRPRTYGRERRPVNLPWRLISGVLVAALVIGLCCAFRADITSFLSQVFSWIIIILVILVIIRLFLFPKRKK